MAYANRTSVPVGQTQRELSEMLKKAGASEIATGWSETEGKIGFLLGGRSYRITVPIPQEREKDKAAQAERSAWRSLGLVVKAKLVAVESGITTIEKEFLAYTVMPDGQTVYDATKARIDAVVASGERMALLP
jgi:hypothetical protein